MSTAAIADGVKDAAIALSSSGLSDGKTAEYLGISKKSVWNFRQEGLSSPENAKIISTSLSEKLDHLSHAFADSITFADIQKLKADQRVNAIEKLTKSSASLRAASGQRETITEFLTEFNVAQSTNVSKRVVKTTMTTREPLPESYPQKSTCKEINTLEGELT